MDLFVRTVYYFVWIIFLPILFIGIIIHIIIDKRQFKAYLQRLGIIKPEQNLSKTIWIHAVSVGEVAASFNLIDEIRKLTNDTIILTCTNIGGYELAKKKIKDKSIKLYFFPMDFPLFNYLYIKRINPKLMIFLEIEIWLSVIHQLYKKNIPIYLVNARLGDAEYPNYKRFSFLFKPTLNKYSMILAQSEQDLTRIKSVGANPDNIFNTGNIKFDMNIKLAENNTIKEHLNPIDNLVILTLASSHNGDEKLILDIFKTLKIKYSNLQLILVPRHIFRTKEIESLISSYNFDYSLRNSSIKKRADILIVNTIGEMLDVYKISDLVIMGGSFSSKIGGHNIIESAILGTPILVGEHMENFRDIVRIFKNENALVELNLKTIDKQIEDYIENTDLRKKLGIKQKAVVEKNKGASKRIIDKVLN